MDRRRGDDAVGGGDNGIELLEVVAGEGTRMPELERWVKESEIIAVAEDAARAVRCEAHRCRPARWELVVIGGLIVYFLWFLSNNASERSELRGAFTEQIMAQINQRLEGFREQVEQEQAAYRKQVREDGKRFADSLQDTQQVADRLLNRLRAVEWSLTTPDAERDASLKQHLDRLDETVRAQPH